MKPSIDEPPVDDSLEHYMEERALAIALAMATTPELQAIIDELMNLRTALVNHREAYCKEASAKRHAHAEIYSIARVSNVNTPGLSREAMDAKVKGLYMEQGRSTDVLRAHARIYFASALICKRLRLVLIPGDIEESAHRLQAREESFARAWIEAVGDPSFADQMRALQREAVGMFRVASEPIASSSIPNRRMEDSDEWCWANDPFEQPLRRDDSRVLSVEVGK